MGEFVLVHHGTKGMKWGIRRYQNKDGSLTPAGRKRYAKDDPEDQVHDDHAKAYGPKPASSMSDKELQEAITRRQREKLYADLTAPKKSTGRQYAEKFVSKLGEKTIETIASEVVNKTVKVGAERVLNKGIATAAGTITTHPKIYNVMKKMGLMT